MRASLRLAAVFAFVFAAVLLVARRADAYPWMIRHGYTQCATCHADPAGGGLLQPYGRAQGEILMRMRYGSPPDKEPGPLAEPLWGAFTPPRALLVGGDIRSAHVLRVPASGEAQGRFILMQADLQSQLSLGRFRVNGSLGAVGEGGNLAAVTRGPDAKLVSRVHWLGVDLGERDEWLVRLGRMNVPFGIRSIEHTMFTRSETRTDINTGQQYGIAGDYHRGRLRASLMGIVGNFAVSPDKFRARGYAGLAELAITPTLAAGVSSMVTYHERDLTLQTEAWRHAHGAFVRWSPARPVVVSAEWDFLHASQPTPGRTFFGGVGQVTVDLEPVQGLHLGPTVEVVARDFDDPASVGAWASAWWFLLPHADLRFDLIQQSLASPTGSSVRLLSTIVQLHVYL